MHKFIQCLGSHKRAITCSKRLLTSSGLPLLHVVVKHCHLLLSTCSNEYSLGRFFLHHFWWPVHNIVHYTHTIHCHLKERQTEWGWNSYTHTVSFHLFLNIIWTCNIHSGMHIKADNKPINTLKDILQVSKKWEKKNFGKCFLKGKQQREHTHTYIHKHAYVHTFIMHMY